jgi:tetratricopeptide (TPR) repeat protein
MAMIAALVLLLIRFDDRAPDANDLLHQAEAAFQAGLDSTESAEPARDHFLRAKQLYTRLRDQGIESADLYRNLGNAALLAGDLSQAILAYRRGLSLAPGDPMLRANLKLARAQVDSSPVLQQDNDWLLSRLPSTPSGWLFPAAYLCYVSSCLFLARWWSSRRDIDLCACLGSVAISLPLVLAICSSSWRAEQERLHPVVVIARDDTHLRKGNGLAYPRLDGAPLHRGVEARLISMRSGWIKIDLASGRTGWVPEKAVLR